MNDLKFNSIKIALDDNGHGSVELNGVPLKYTSRVTFDARAGSPTYVTITFLGDVEFSGPGRVRYVVTIPSEDILPAE